MSPNIVTSCPSIEMIKSPPELIFGKLVGFEPGLIAIQTFEHFI